MFRRFFKVLLTLLLLVLIAVVGLIVMIMNVEDPLSFTILSEQPAEAGAGGSSTYRTRLECEVKNTSPFPMEFLPTTSILLPAKDATTAFLPSSDIDPVAIRLTPGQTWQGKLYGPKSLDPTDIHTFSYDWNVRGQIELRAVVRWLDQNASFIPDSWLSGLFWRTEPSKGRVKHVAMPNAAGAGTGDKGAANKEAPKATVP